MSPELPCDRQDTASESPQVWVELDAGNPEAADRARALAADLGLPLRDASVRTAHAGDVSAEGTAGLVLVVDNGRLGLRETAPGAPGPVFAEFAGGPVGARRRRGGGRRDPIARAVGLGAGTTRIVDATAGLGRDAFLFACLGCDVLAVERSPIVAALLRDGLARARAAAGPGEFLDLDRRLRLVVADARVLLGRLTEAERPDAVYIDPMYPPRRASALVKKEMRVLRRLVGDDEDAAELLVAALAVARRRVVVKRHARSPLLGGVAPAFSLTGRTTRFDVHVLTGGLG